MAKKDISFWDRQHNRRTSNGHVAADRRELLADIQEALPCLRAFLLGDVVGDVQIKGGSIVVFCDLESPKILLRDRHHGQVAFLTETTWGGLLEAVERGLESDDMKWRVDKFGTQKVGGKK